MNQLEVIISSQAFLFLVPLTEVVRKLDENGNDSDSLFLLNVKKAVIRRIPLLRDGKRIEPRSMVVLNEKGMVPSWWNDNLASPQKVSMATFFIFFKMSNQIDSIKKLRSVDFENSRFNDRFIEPQKDRDLRMKNKPKFFREKIERQLRIRDVLERNLKCYLVEEIEKKVELYTRIIDAINFKKPYPSFITEEEIINLFEKLRPTFIDILGQVKKTVQTLPRTENCLKPDIPRNVRKMMDNELGIRQEMNRIRLSHYIETVQNQQKQIYRCHNLLESLNFELMTQKDPQSSKKVTTIPFTQMLEILSFLLLPSQYFFTEARGSGDNTKKTVYDQFKHSLLLMKILGHRIENVFPCIFEHSTFNNFTRARRRRNVGEKELVLGPVIENMFGHRRNTYQKYVQEVKLVKKSRLRQQEEAFQNLKTEIEETKLENIQLKRKLATLPSGPSQEELEGLASQLRLARKEIDEKRKKMDEMDEKMKKNDTAHKIKIATCTTTHQKMEDKMTQLSNELQTARNLQNFLYKKDEEQQRKITHYLDENENLRKASHKKDEEKSKLTKKINEFRLKINRIEKIIDEKTDYSANQQDPLMKLEKMMLRIGELEETLKNEKEVTRNFESEKKVWIEEQKKILEDKQLLLSMIDELDKVKEIWKKDLQEKKDEIQTLRSGNSKLGSENERLEEQVEQVESKNEKLEESNEQLSRKLFDEIEMKNALSERIKKHEDALVNNEKDEVRKEVRNLKEFAEKISKMYEKSKKEVSDKQRQIEIFRSQIGRIKKQLDFLSEKLRKRNENVEMYQIKIRELKKELQMSNNDSNLNSYIFEMRKLLLLDQQENPQQQQQQQEEGSTIIINFIKKFEEQVRLLNRQELLVKRRYQNFKDLQSNLLEKLKKTEDGKRILDKKYEEVKRYCLTQKRVLKEYKKRKEEAVEKTRLMEELYKSEVLLLQKKKKNDDGEKQ